MAQRDEIAARHAKRYRDSDDYRQYTESRISPFGRRLAALDRGTTRANGRHAREPDPKANRWRALPTLVARHLRIRLRCKPAALVFLMLPVVFALTTLWLASPTSTSAGLPRSLPISLSALLTIAITATFSGILSGCLELSSEREVFRRERMAGLSATVYVVSKLPFLFALTAMQCMVFVGIFMVSPELRQMSMMALVPAMVGTAWAACALGLLVSALDPTPGRLSV
ncbi:MAG: ABC transporter permease, partial [Wenzhouxiangellaceae bacterium]